MLSSCNRDTDPPLPCLVACHAVERAMLHSNRQLKEDIDFPLTLSSVAAPIPDMDCPLVVMAAHQTLVAPISFLTHNLESLCSCGSCPSQGHRYQQQQPAVSSLLIRQESQKHSSAHKLHTCLEEMHNSTQALVPAQEGSCHLLSQPFCPFLNSPVQLLATGTGFTGLDTRLLRHHQHLRQARCTPHHA